MSDLMPECMAPDGAEPCEAYTALLQRIEELQRRISQMQGDGYCSAAEALADWWNQANVQGVANMTGDELMEMCAEWQTYGRAVTEG